MMAAIKSHLSMAELEGRYETAADPISKSHFHGLWLLSKGLEIEEVAELLSGATVEIWAMDEHRIGLKPITRGVWAPKGERPLALGHHRYEWLYVHGFVEPATGRTMWNVSNAVCKEMFEAVLANFAKSIDVGDEKRVVIQLGPQNLSLPDGIRLVFQPSHSPELQPAEHLWQFVDEPLANTYFDAIEDLDKAVGERCVALMEQRDMVRASTLFHWWPRS